MAQNEVTRLKIPLSVTGYRGNKVTKVICSMQLLKMLYDVQLQVTLSNDR